VPLTRVKNVPWEGAWTTKKSLELKNDQPRAVKTMDPEQRSGKRRKEGNDYAKKSRPSMVIHPDGRTKPVRTRTFKKTKNQKKVKKKENSEI